MKKSLLFKASIILAVLVFAVAGVLVYNFAIKPRGNTDLKTVSVVIITGDGAGDTHTFDNIKTNQPYVLGLLEELNEAENIGFITEELEWAGVSYTTQKSFFGVGVDNINTFYSFYVGEDFSNFGIAETPVEDGVTYKFVYTVFAAALVA